MADEFEVINMPPMFFKSCYKYWKVNCELVILLLYFHQYGTCVFYSNLTVIDLWLKRFLLIFSVQFLLSIAILSNSLYLLTARCLLFMITSIVSFEKLIFLQNLSLIRAFVRNELTFKFFRIDIFLFMLFKDHLTKCFSSMCNNLYA